jgi:hypothetical protein
MGLNVTREYTDSGTNAPSTKVMFQFSLRTLGQVRFSQNLDLGSSTQ